jgi:hypothetical protein
MAGESSGQGGFNLPSVDEATARALVAGHLDALLAHKDEVASLDAAQVRALAEIAVATRSDCGGIGCG